MITQEDIIYFIVTDRFKNSKKNEIDLNYNPRHYYGGDFKGIEQKIEYLEDLGITALWITPVYLNIGRYGESDSYHGYWTMDFEKVDPTLSFEENSDKKEELKKLVQKLKNGNKGIKVILDMVVNHTGYHNQSYLNYHDAALNNDNEDSRFGSKWFNKNGQGDIKMELSGLPDLNHDNVNVRDYFVNNITDWILETGIDAIRMDTVKHVEDAFWHAFKTYVRGRFPEITLIGEVLTPEAEKIAKYQTLMDFDSLFDFPLQQTIVATLVKEGPMTWLARPRIFSDEPKGVLDIDTQYYTNANRLVTLLDNHDLDIGRIKTAILNHAGHWDRFLCMKMLKLCISFLFTTRGIPQIYYGTEIGMEGEKDPYNRGVFRWDLLNNDNDSIEAKEAKEILNFTKQLIQLRKSNECLQYGYLFTLYADQFIYAYMREYRNELIIVTINNGRGDMSIPLEIKIRENNNIPVRIKELCKEKQLINLIEENDSIVLTDSNFEILLKGKEVKILKLLNS